MNNLRPGGRVLQRGVLWALVLVGLATASGPALAASPTVDRSSQVQAMLDRVLGPGNAVVQIAATVQAGDGSRSSVTWGSVVPSVVAVSRQQTAAGTTVGVTRVDQVSSSTTMVVVPAGTLVRQSVAVAVDRTAARGIATTRLRQLVAAAVGLTPARGDRLSILRAPFPHPHSAAMSRPAWYAILVPFAVRILEVAGGAIGLLVLLIAVRSRSRRTRVS